MSSLPATIMPPGEPEVRRKFQLTNLDGNSNKYYMVETWPLPCGEVFFRATYGRVGTRPQYDEKVTDPSWVERKVREKTSKGYQEVTLHRTAATGEDTITGVALDPAVERLVTTIYAEAGNQIASFLAGSVDALSVDQIAQGRALLLAVHQQYIALQRHPAPAMRQALAGTIQRFYNTIPTQLPSRIEREQVVLDFCNQFGEYEDRLNQLEAAVATFSAQQGRPQLSLYETLGAELAALPQVDSRFQQICDYIEQTCVHSYSVRVRDVFSVTIPDERRAFEQSSVGRKRVELLFHGTASQNVRHILRSGLICPRVPAHGRMFGHGIYFANKVSKSANYCRVSKRGIPYMLCLADVALGKAFVANEAMPVASRAPNGYDSIWGKAGETQSWGNKLQFDEHVIYANAQQTLRYIVTFDR